jgi:hypothetical protein
MSEKNVLSRNVVIAFIVVIVLVWVLYYLIGSPSFNKSNAVSIYGTIIQGMSALMSVALAVVIFRIQSLENRNQSLEQSTLDYIHRITQWTYPQWIPSLEENIRDGSITERYSQSHGTSDEERNLQQKRLEETLNLHTATDQRIQRTKNRIMITLAFLITPILMSLFLLMISDAFASLVTFYSVSIVILLSAFGVVCLILTVLDSLP